MTLPHRRRTQRVDSDRGATAVEYGLMIGLIAIVILVAVSALGNALSGIFGTSATSV